MIRNRFCLSWSSVFGTSQSLIWENVPKGCKAISQNQIRVTWSSTLFSNDPIYFVFILNQPVAIAQRPDTLLLPRNPDS